MRKQEDEEFFPRCHLTAAGLTHALATVTIIAVLLLCVERHVQVQPYPFHGKRGRVRSRGLGGFGERGGGFGENKGDRRWWEHLNSNEGRSDGTKKMTLAGAHSDGRRAARGGHVSICI